MSVQKAKLPRKRPAVCWSIEGVGGSGKTDLALQSPGPVAVLPFDVRSMEVVDKYREAGKEIVLPAGGPYRLQFGAADISDAAVKEAAKPVWNRFLSDLRGVLAKGIRTVVLDSATHAWKMFVMSQWGRTSSIRPHHYGPMNFEFCSILRGAWDAAPQPTNLMLIHELTDEYVSTGKVDKEGNEVRGKSGRLVRDGCKKMEFLLGSELSVWFDRDTKLFRARFGICKTNMQATGEELELPWVAPSEGVGEAWQTLAAFARPDVELERWGS